MIILIYNIIVIMFCPDSQPSLLINRINRYPDAQPRDMRDIPVAYRAGRKLIRAAARGCIVHI